MQINQNSKKQREKKKDMQFYLNICSLIVEVGVVC